MNNTTNSRHTYLTSAIIMWAMGAAFYFYEFMLQVSTSVMVPDLMRTFDISAHTLGYLSATWFFMYAPMQVPVGALLDKYGPRRLLITATSVCAVGGFLFGSATSFGIALIARGMMGFGAAFAVVGCMKIIANWFPMNRFALMLGLLLTVGMLGALSGVGPMSTLVSAFDWRGAMHFLGITGAIIVTLMFFLLKDSPHATSTAIPTSSDQNWKTLFSGLKVVVRSKQTWLASIYGSLMFSPTLVFAGLWGPNFLEQAQNMDRQTAAFCTSLIFVGWAVGSPLIGWFSDFIGRRKVTMFLGAAGLLLVTSLIIYSPHLSVLTVQILLFCFGVFSSGFLMAFPLVQEINPPKYNATAMGFINFLNSLGGALVQPLVGLLLDLYWSGAIINDIPHYGVMEYRKALCLLPISIGLAILILPFIKETYCKNIYNETERTAS